MQPRSSKSEIVGIHDGMLKVKLKSPPVDGQANEALIKYLAKLIKLPKTSVVIAKGDKSKRKKIKLLTKDIDSVINTIKLYV